MTDRVWSRGRAIRWLAVYLVASLLAPGPALAQAWQSYRYADQGVSFQSPAKPDVTTGTYALDPGVSVPATIYTAKQDNVVYTLTVADLSKTPIDQKAAIDGAEKRLSAGGTVTFSVDARIDRDYGRELSVSGADGSRSSIALFYVNRHLYQLVGMALPPDAAAGSGNTIRFQQSLQFGGPPGGGFGGGGFGGGGRRGFGGGGPNPEAQAACAGKKAGDAVSITTPEGKVAATCVLVARPNRPPRGGPGADGPPPPPPAND
jgi:hypothetical protein